MKSLRIATALFLLVAALPLRALAAAPTAASFSTAVPVGVSSVIQLQGADPDGTPLVYATPGAPSHGSLSQLNTATGSLIYTPAAGYTGTDSFTYTVTSGGATTAAATVSITVTSAKTRVIDTLLNPDGTPRQGRVTFVLTQAATSPSGLIAAKSTVSATLTSSGGFDVQLYPSRMISPQQKYQVWFYSADGSSSLLGVYDIPAATGTIILSPYRVTDTALAVQYVFASQAGIESLRNQIADAVLADLISVARTTGKLQKWDGSNLSDSIVAESVAGLAVAGHLMITGNAAVTGNLSVAGAITGSGAGLHSVPNSALPSTFTGKTLNTPTITGPTTANGNVTVVGDLNATRLFGDGSNLTGIAGASGGVSNAGNTAIASTGGVITFSTGGVERLRITADGRMTGQAANAFWSVFNVKDFGALGNGTGDDGAAIQSAVNALAAVSPLRSAILYFPEGKYRMTTGVTKNFTNLKSNIVLLGAGSGSRLLVDGGASLVAFRFDNLDSLDVGNLVVHGNPATASDALRVFELRGVWQARFDRVNFYGLATLEPGGATIWSSDTNLAVTNSAFRGCAARYDVDPAATTGVIQAEDSRGLLVENVQFPDYGHLDNVFHSKSPMASARWITVRNPAAAADSFLTQGGVTLRGLQMDEGASNHVRITGATHWFDTVTVEDVQANIGIAEGIYIDGARNVRLSDVRYTYASAVPPNRDAIRVLNADNVLAERPVLRYHSNSLRFDNTVKSARVVNGIYTSLLSSASRTEEVIDGATARVYFRPTSALRPCSTSEAIMFLDASDGKLKVCESGGSFRAVLSGGSNLALLDDFNDNSRDAAKWNLLTSAGFTVAETGGLVQITPPASSAGTGEAGYETVSAYDFAADGKVSVSVPSLATGAAGGPLLRTALILFTGTDSYKMLYEHATNQISASSTVGGVTLDQNLLEPSAATLYWRLRYDSTANTMYWDTSSDGIAWTQRHSRTGAPLPLASAKARLSLEINATGTISESTRFDNFALTRVAN